MLYLGDSFWVSPEDIVAIRRINPAICNNYRTEVILSCGTRVQLLVSHKTVMERYFTGKDYKRIEEKSEPDIGSLLKEIKSS